MSIPKTSTGYLELDTSRKSPIKVKTNHAIVIANVIEAISIKILYFFILFPRKIACLINLFAIK